MSLRDYEVKRDWFSEDMDVPPNGFGFPCCGCDHRFKSDDAYPCRICDHNANAVKEKQEGARNESSFTV